MMTDLLGIYLQDHETGATAGCRRFRRVAETHSDASVRTAVSELADEGDADHEELLEIMAQLGYKPSSIKQFTAVVGEAAGALKPNGRVTDRSPLADVLELEALTLAVSGKALGWELLLQRPVTARALGVDRLERLLGRAEEQARRLDELRMACAAKILGDDENPSG